MSRWKAAICERVRSIRKQRGLTIDAAAKELGLEAQRYRTYERRSLMPLYYLIQLADQVNMPLDALVRIDGTPPLVVSSEAKFRPTAPRDSRGGPKTSIETDI